MGNDLHVTAALLGRERQISTLEGVIEATLRGRSRVVRMDGEPGMGKTALVEHVVRHALERDILVLRTWGAQAEQHLSFAAVHRLLIPILDRLGRLPAGQQGALRAVLGLQEVPRMPERFVVALAVLELVADAAARQPVLIAVDDRQWLDPSSLDVLEFLAHRLEDLAVGVLFVQRDRDDLLRDDSLRLHLTALDDAVAATIVRHRFPDLATEEIQDLVRLAEGNPLALHELTPEDVHLHGAARSELDAVPHLSDRLQDAFGARVQQLPTETRFVCLVAALQDGDRLSQTLAAASRRSDRAGQRHKTHLDIEAAERAGVLVVRDGTVSFRHPLVRAAVISQATLEERRRAHRALAGTLSEDPARQACHQAAATLDIDESAAAHADDMAERCLAQGAVVLAHTLFRHAARLSPPGRAQNHRLLRLAEVAFEMGRYTEVRQRVDRFRLGDLHQGDRARLVRLQMVFDDGVPEGPDAVHRFVQSSLEASKAGQRDLAGGLLVVAARNTYWAASTSRLGPQIGEAVVGLDATPEQQLYRLVVDTFLDPFAAGPTVMAALRSVDPAQLDDEVVALLSQAGFVAGDFDRSLELASSAASGLRRDGRLGLLAAALVLQSFSALYLGRWDIMLTASDEAARLAAETRQPVWLACAQLAQANLAGLRDMASDPTTVVADVERLASTSGNASLMNGVQLSRGLSALGSGDPARAYAELSRMFDPNDVAFHIPQSAWAVDYLLEAASMTGDLEPALGPLRRVEELARPTQAAGLLRATSLARLFASHPQDVDSRYTECTAVPSTAWHRARRDLFYGSVLRRRRQARRARPLLSSAAATFEALGAKAWAERAATELAATGIRRTATSTPEAWARLSAQELQVARLAAAGLSNREIAARLYLSHRTVASHLYRLYPKLGVSSRRQLPSVPGLAPTDD